MNSVISLIFLLLFAATAAAHPPVKPEELHAPLQNAIVGDCPTYDGNKFLWKSSCGAGSIGQAACHTHPCVNKFCFEPRQCPTPGWYQIGIGGNGDAICAPFAALPPTSFDVDTIVTYAEPAVVQHDTVGLNVFWSAVIFNGNVVVL